jgi:putative phage-type endonuclease
MSGIEILPYDTPREQWLAERRNGIGGSDIAAILGLSHFTSPYSLWISKIGELPDTASSAMRWGQVLEAPILGELAAQQTGVTIRRQGLTRHDDHDWARYSPDAILDERESHLPVGLVEVKTSLSPSARTIWTGDDIPEHVWIQVQWGLEILGLPGAVVAALVTGPLLLLHEVERDETTGQGLLDAAAQWWDRHVVGRVPPDVDGHKATTEVLRRIPARTGSPVELDPDTILPLLTQRRIAQMQLAEAEQRAAAVDNRIRHLLGEHDEGLVNGERVVTWRQVERKASMTKASTYRQLRVSDDHG